MAGTFNKKVDFIVRTDGLLKDYLESVVVKRILAEMPDSQFKKMSPRHIRAALLLRSIAPCSLKQFATVMRMSKAAASAQVDRMVKTGTVQRDINPENRREVILKITPGLEEHINHVHQEVTRWLDSMSEELGQETMDQWYEVMLAVNTALMKRLKPGETSY